MFVVIATEVSQGACLHNTTKLANPENSNLVQEFGTYLLYNPSYSQQQI